MNRKIWLGVLILVILGLIGAFLIPGKLIAPAPSPTPSNTPTPPLTDCGSPDLQATINYSGAAGSTYGNLTLKNISTRECQVTGQNYILVNYDKNTVPNLTISDQGTTHSQPFQLQPNQTLYSQIRYPNGAECSGPTTQIPVTFEYGISPTTAVTFSSDNGESTHQLPVCQSNSQTTQVEVWSLSNQPTSP